ncbi:MAG: DEAD/DEAH box helicase [Limisphaerales bacterium]
MPKAQHPKTASFVRQNLFAGVTTFVELETRVAALPDEQSRGDAFEVFAEAYLATQRKHDAANVWPLTAVPSRILQSLGLAAKDYGVDGVFKTLLGNFNAYQVKFRTNRPALTWRELSTFMGLADSPQIRSRVLLTNCDELPSVLNERQGFFCIRGSDFDRLEADDFRAIEAWLAAAAFIAPKKQPQPHQTEALYALLPALETHDRVSAIMACGTGKTLVALWVAERRQASRILVLIPSLALLRQLLHEWLRETSLPSLAYLCVCSDPTVKDSLDSIATAQSDLDFQVSTDSASVRDFLDASFTGAKVIFSTYQSARVVGEALKPGEAFDLAVFDEAHKTAGREGRNFAFALEDANLPIRKRLFLTATPRHYSPHQQGREGEAQLVFSMDRPDVYGLQAYCLTFAEAARRGIICGYKVIISVITSEMVTNELLSRADVLVNGDAVRARQVANQIALRDAVEKYGARKAFTFHRTVASAASFVADGSEGIRTHLPEFETFHVNGTMPTARREREMRDFRAAARAVMSNARCLTEGVDVPAVDMVAFLSPRRSRVDIVQATGRAMRRSPGKTTGYVLVPLYAEQAADETVEAAVSRSAFDEVWDVLHSLQEQDDVLAELIRYAGEQKGRGKGFDDRLFVDRIDFGGPQLSLDALRASVATQCVDALIAPWDYWIGKIKAFHERFGHCTVPTGWEEDAALSSWVNAIRTKFGKGLLSRDRIQQLNDVGFSWNARAQSKRDNVLRLLKFLKKYKEKYGNCNVPVDFEENPRLGRWVASIRTQKRDGQCQLPQNLIGALDALGFVWDYRGPAVGEAWFRTLEELRMFKQRFGHCNVGTYGDYIPLGRWVVSQRVRRKKGVLGEDQIRLLDELGFVWDFQTQKTQATWMKWYRELEAYAIEHGNPHVPRTHANTKLASWVWIQRIRREKAYGNTPPLTEDQVALLDTIAFRWDPYEEKWAARLEQLKHFKEQHGHCEVGLVADADAALHVWVSQQRSLLARGKIDAERRAKLDALGFSWSGEMTDRRWEEMYQSLKNYHTQHGNPDVPHRWKEDMKLAAWVSQQRQRRRKGLIMDEQVRLLDELGFTWQHRERGSWEDRYQELVEFKAKHGHCNVPFAYEEQSKLGAFVNSMRNKKASGDLSQQRIELLERIGIQWAVRELTNADAWESRYAQLTAFKATHGHCKVPNAWPENPSLGRWVGQQRQQKKSGKLHPKREEMLNAIGFDWGFTRDLGGVKPKDLWALRYSQLVEFKNQNGHCVVPYSQIDNRKLGNWVGNQRSNRKRNKLTPERERLLNEIGFSWTSD